MRKVHTRRKRRLGMRTNLGGAKVLRQRKRWALKKLLPKESSPS